MEAVASTHEVANTANTDAEKTTETQVEAPHPLPWRQLIVLAVCRIPEPIAFCSILTYSFLMVQDIHGDENANMYSGILISVFPGAEALTAWIWGDLSDRLGRKPCILVAMAGTALSCLIFGFSKRYWMAITARILGGCLNGNTAVMQTMIAELVKNPRYEPVTFSMPPSIWYVGAMAGAALGGCTARPVKRWPRLRGTIFEEYPYLLPNILSTVLVAVAGLVTWLFLEETNIRQRRPLKWKTSVFFHAWIRMKEVFRGPSMSHRTSVDSSRGFLDEDNLDPQRNIKAMTKPVLGWIFALFLLSYHQMAFTAQLPPFLENDADPKNFFDGGLGKTLSQVTVIQNVSNGISLLAQGVIYPLACSKIGVWKYTFTALALAIIPYTILPMTKNLPSPDAGLYTVIALQCLATTASYPLISILLKNSVPSPEVLGRVTGVAMSLCSLARTFAPPLVGVISDKLGASACWWSMAGVAAAGFAQLFFFRRPAGTN